MYVIRASEKHMVCHNAWDESAALNRWVFNYFNYN